MPRPKVNLPDSNPRKTSPIRTHHAPRLDDSSDYQEVEKEKIYSTGLTGIIQQMRC